MSKIHRIGRPPRREGDKTPVTVKFADDELKPIDEQVDSGHARDRSAVIRDAVEQSATKWAGEWAMDKDFDTLMSRARDDERSWRSGSGSGYYRVMLAAAGTCPTPAAAHHFRKTIEQLDDPLALTRVMLAGQDSAVFTAHTPRQDRDGIIAARYSAMLSLATLPSDNPFRIELARQVFCIDRWSSDPVDSAPHTASNRPGPRVDAMTDAEIKLREIAEPLVAQKVPYAFGGGNLDGPTQGMRDGGWADQCGDYAKIGFDSGALSRYMIWQAFNIEIPRTDAQQYHFGTPVDRPEPGDLVFLDVPSYNVVYLGSQQVIVVGRPGEFVRLNPLIVTTRTQFVRVRPPSA
ncbi:hypothetical protein D2E76_15965 [Mycobacteroides abscessus]|uniref:NlpC/P60 domain-containing protein n=1 Tax=Mycobacteroides abscessus TaxID=36809 RepID=A0ABD7HLT4_9MYCO|nr:NlpC/P60 family protein [Mycobacteroides abscessus]RIT36754.1 hypothetical protein D2E76_15965 [Mycobacteroides abscessus]